ncbi:MAG: Ppx/GppA phosphatase family protein [bacterium]
MKIAVIDVGTNTTRLMIFDCENAAEKKPATSGALMIADGGKTYSFKTLYEEDTVTRLGENLSSGTLQASAVERTLKTMKRFRDKVRKSGAEKIITVGTSALRGATNKQFFIDAVKGLDITLEVISGEDEAKFAFSGAVLGREISNDETALVIDIGGGSTELVFGRGNKLEKWLSVNEGAVRLTERFIRSDPPSSAELAEMQNYVDGEINETKTSLSLKRIDHGIGVAGTIVSLAMIAQRLRIFAPKKIHGYNISFEEVERLYHLLAASTVGKRKTIRGMEPGRADVIPAGTYLLLSIMRSFDIKKLEVSLNDLRHGVLWNEIKK